ncbi:alpha/beta hydrolase [Mesorhizobium delmotii]|uniref:Dienelactone hydrolase n=1 Tax=Mesorhizobium delmotii TaxID=1631247 RepID=A0A2P9ARZ9_9HYPH
MLKILTLAAATAVALGSSAFAAPRVERVTFASHSEQIVGDLYLPEDMDPAKARPALVVTGAWMTVKEQMAARYAREMADRGFVALTFDFRGWGESGGARRQYEDPSAKIADIEAAVAYLATRPEVSKDSIGGLGICASSGYMVTAAAKDAGIKSVALVAPWLHDAEVVEQTYGGKDGVARLEAAGNAPRPPIAAPASRHSCPPPALPTSGRTCSRCPTTPSPIAA